MLSHDEIWKAMFDEKLTGKIIQITRLSTVFLNELDKEGKRLDFIFIDGTHDPYTVIADLAYSVKLLNSGGMILMVDFAPLEEYGIGACLAIPHMKRWFEYAEVFYTEGIIYGGDEYEHFPRAMVFLRGLKKTADKPVGRLKLAWWRIVGFVFAKSYRQGAFRSTNIFI